jgi:hypothetical protein
MSDPRELPAKMSQDVIVGLLRLYLSLLPSKYNYTKFDNAVADLLAHRDQGKL